MSMDGASAEKIARRVIERAMAGDFEGASRDFTEAMRAALPPDKLAATWAALAQQVGALTSVANVTVRSEEGHRTVLMDGQFERTELLIRLSVDSDGRVEGLFFQPKPKEIDWAPPAYADPALFEERAVEVGSRPALPGVLTMPKSEGAHAAVVLVHGSGPNDQDESVGGCKVFKDLAWGLASRGIAVLRYVKRTRHAPAGVVTQKEEVIDGARDAVELLRGTPGVDPDRVFVLGHSQGGYLAPRMAREIPGLAGLVILAGSTRPLQDSMVDQLEYFERLSPGVPQVTAMLEAARKFKAIVEDPSLTADQLIELPTGGAATGAYFLDVRDYHPPTVAKELSCRMLILQGERDYQVTSRDFDGWQAALAGLSNVTLKTYPALNHLFVAGEGTPSPAEYQATGHVDAQVIADIAAFVG
ncbi:MAG: alpha/beta fold hydrolase [Polyangiaceae bacterium]